MGRKKGSLKETLSYAMHKDDPTLFSVNYRDRDAIKTETLSNFMAGEEFYDIPITRIVEIIRDGKVVWERGQKQVKVKRLPC
ncbi:MAG: hypothetical protein ACREBS_08445 [Nitrososphaerales archaeon]